MNIRVGDLVKCGQKIGLVVDRKLPSEGLSSSMHVRHMVNSYPHVYYVYFSEEGRTGPFRVGELTLQQSVSNDAKH